MSTKYQKVTKETHKALQAYIHKFVQLSERDEEIAAGYAMMTWIYPEFDSLKYLLIIGEAATGKTISKNVIGHICYKPMFLSGIMSKNSLLNEMDVIQGTAIFEEFTIDDDGNLKKNILQGGSFKKTGNLIQTKVEKKKEFTLRTYSIYGPKIIISRIPLEASIMVRSIVIKLEPQKDLRSDLVVVSNHQLEQEAEKLHSKIQTWMDMTIQREHAETFTGMLEWICGFEIADKGGKR